MEPAVNVAILGASGYGAGELLRLLTQHPAVEVACVTSTSAAGELIEAVHPHLAGFYPGLRVSESVDVATLSGAGRTGVIISALPHGSSGAAVARFLTETDAGSRSRRTAVAAGKLASAPARSQPGGSVSTGPRLIDLSGDMRLSCLEAHRRHYPESAALESERREFVYGLPELNRERIAEARCVANPGCLATAAILAAAPLVGEGFEGTVVVDAKTGSSGSGRALKETTHHPTRHADFRAYKPLAHQHEPEILQAWGDPHGERIGLSFVAQSMDAARGIFVTVHLTLAEEVSAEELRGRYAAFYKASPFVRMRRESPTLQDVAGSNFCDIAVAARGRQVIAMAALDNLVKGMAGTAIQNMNLMCGFSEKTGLWTPSMRPI